MEHHLPGINPAGIHPPLTIMKIAPHFIKRWARRAMDWAAIFICTVSIYKMAYVEKKHAFSFDDNSDSPQYSTNPFSVFSSSSNLRSDFGPANHALPQ